METGSEDSSADSCSDDDEVEGFNGMEVSFIEGGDWAWIFEVGGEFGSLNRRYLRYSTA